MNTRLSLRKFRLSRPHPSPHPHPHPHLPPLPSLSLLPGPLLQKPIPQKTTPGNPPTLPKSPNGAPNPPLSVTRPNSPALNGKPSVPAKKPTVRPSVNHPNPGTVSAIISPPPSPPLNKWSHTPSRHRPLLSVRSNMSRPTRNQRRAQNARGRKRRTAHRLSHGNTSRPLQRLPTLPCPSQKPPYPSHPLINMGFSRRLPHQHQFIRIRLLEWTGTQPTFLLRPSPPSWTTGSHDGHDYHSYYPRLLLTYYFRSLMASCLVSERSLPKRSWDGLVGNRGVEVGLLALDFGDEGIPYHASRILCSGVYVEYKHRSIDQVLLSTIVHRRACL